MNEILTIGTTKFKVRKDSYDKDIVAGEILNSPYHLPENMKVVIDIGAHLGGTTLLCASMGAEVYAYEPEEENFKLLVENVKANHYQDKVHCINLAVGGEGTRKLHLCEINSGGYGYYAGWEKTEKVFAISFRDVMKKIDSCDLLKMDCEGCEYDSFFENFDTELFKKIKQISLELHCASKGFENKELEKNYGLEYARRLMDILSKYYTIDVYPSSAASAKMVICKQREF